MHGAELGRWRRRADSAETAGRVEAVSSTRPMPGSLDDVRYTLARALRRQRLKALARDRLGEPFLFNLASVAVAAFGSFRAREAFELINRPHYAWSLLDAADSAAASGLPGVLGLEFGVAAGAGLLN